MTFFKLETTLFFWILDCITSFWSQVCYLISIFTFWTCHVFAIPYLSPLCVFQPENVLIEQTSAQPLVKLTDFGDAAHLSSTPYIHPLLGSPEFSAPELVLGEPVALASDLWSLGVLAYVMLSGASPFLDESVEETCLNICRLDFSFPEDYFRGVSPAALDLVCVLLQGEPCRRPSAQVCLHEQQWLQPNAASGAARLDTSRLISFIERRKHQNDLRPVASFRAFLHSRLLSQSWEKRRNVLLQFLVGY